MDRNNNFEYGFDAEVISIPGHFQGSIRILTADGDLFCCYLYENTAEPGLNTIMDDLATAQASAEKLKGYAIDLVYPGHGEFFPITMLRTE